MAFPTAQVAVGDTGTGTASALDASSNVVTTATAPVVVTSSDPTILSVVDNGSAAGVDNVTWTAVADGSVQITGSYTDPVSGAVISSGPNNPLTIIVGAPADQVTQVSLA